MSPAAHIRGRLGRQEGQVVPLVALWMVVLIGFAALVIDVGRLYIAHEQLQDAVNASALAAGRQLPSSLDAYHAAITYGGASGEQNALGGYGVSAQTPLVTFRCDTHAVNYYTSTDSCPTDTSNNNCQPNGAQATYPAGATTCNAVEVSENATVKTTFAGLFNLPQWKISASAIASAGGGGYFPMHAYVILDNTGSMTDSCGTAVTGNGNGTNATGISSGDATKLDCAKSGVRALLQLLWPCKSENDCGSVTQNVGELGANVAAPDDEVGMLVVPAITGNPPTTSVLDNEIDCDTDTQKPFDDEYPPWTDYTDPLSIPAGDQYIGYEAVGLSSDYRQSDSPSSSTLNWVAGADDDDGNASDLVESVDWGQCPSSVYPATTTTTETVCTGHGRNQKCQPETVTTPTEYPYNYGLKDIGGHGSYLAGAITEAEYLLQQNAEPGVSNVIIIESDGEMTDPVTFSDNTQSDTSCEDADEAATEAKAAGTTIYTIEYGSSSTSGTCGPDNPRDVYDNPGTLMEDMASVPKDYIPDADGGDLTGDFAQVGEDLTLPRLIPQCTQAPPSC